MENNIDRKKLLDAVAQIGKNQKLSNAVAKKDMQGILNELDPAQSAELKKLMSDKASLEKLLNSPQAQMIMRSLSKDGK